MASLLLITLAVNLQQPLYAHYAALSRASAGMLTVAFACYVGGLLPALILFGGASARIGCKATIVIGLGCSFAATTLVALHPGLAILFPARVLQGLGVGLSVSAGSAYLVELLPGIPRQVATAVGMATTLGFGGGALVTTLTDLSGRRAVPASYPLVAALLILSGVVLVALVPSTPPDPSVRLMRAPLMPRRLVPAALSIGAAWAVSGVVVAVLPRELTKLALGSWAGPALFLLNAAGAVVQPLARRWAPTPILRAGLLLLLVGYGGLLAGVATGSLTAILLGVTVAGTSCYGLIYLGGLRSVTEGESRETARRVAGFFTAAYLGFGLPTVLIGFLADRLGVVSAMAVFGAVLVVVTLATMRGVGKAATGDRSTALADA